MKNASCKRSRSSHDPNRRAAVIGGITGLMCIRNLPMLVPSRETPGQRVCEVLLKVCFHGTLSPKKLSRILPAYLILVEGVRACSRKENAKGIQDRILWQASDRLSKEKNNGVFLPSEACPLPLLEFSSGKKTCWGVCHETGTF